MRTLIDIALLAALVALGTTEASGSPGGETARLVASDGAQDDAFGVAVAIDGSLAAIGASDDDDLGWDSGSVYLFDTSTGQELMKLHASDGAVEDRFGLALALRGSTLLVGAPHNDDNGLSSGSAYLFDAATGIQTHKLLAPDGLSADFFGASLALDGGLAVIGAPGDGWGSAYVVDAVSGAQLRKLVPDEGAVHDWFGASLALQGGILVVGAPRHDANGTNSGAAYTFDVATGNERLKLLPDDPGEYDRFGNSVAISGQVAVVGAYTDDVFGLSSGSAYLFDVTTGVQLAKLVPTDPGIDQMEQFGYAVAIEGATAIVTTRYDSDGGPFSGSAYLFDVPSGMQIGKRIPTDNQPSDYFGCSVAVSGDSMLVGAYNAHAGAPDTGAAYLLDATEGLVRAFCFGDGTGAACPCGNLGDPGRGCASGPAPEGALLWWQRSACVSHDKLRLRATDTTPGQTGVFLQGDDALNGGQGLTFGDGLRCAGNNVVRLQIAVGEADGTAHTTVPIASAGGVTAGDVKRYQWWFRDPAGSPCGAGFNLSNGLEVVWGP